MPCALILCNLSSHLSCRIAVTELTDSFDLLRKTLKGFETNDSKLEPQSINSNKEETPDDKDIQSEAITLEETTPGSSLGQCQSAHELESIIIFDLCALSEIATSKSAILRVRVLHLLVQNLKY